MSRRRLPGDQLRRVARKAERGARRWRWFGIGQFASYAEVDGHRLRISVAPGMPINTGTETAIIRIDSTGAVTAPSASSHGQDWKRLWRRLSPSISARASRTSGIVQGDSAAVAGGTGTYASRSLVLAGGAATLTAQAVREKVFNAARICLKSRRLISPPKTQSVGCGTDRSLTFREVARGLFGNGSLAGRGAREELAATKPTIPCSALHRRLATSRLSK